MLRLKESKPSAEKCESITTFVTCCLRKTCSQQSDKNQSAKLKKWKNKFYKEISFFLQAKNYLCGFLLYQKII